MLVSMDIAVQMVPPMPVDPYGSEPSPTLLESLSLSAWKTASTSAIPDLQKDAIEKLNGIVYGVDSASFCS